MHTGSNFSAPVWLRYLYQRGTDKKNGAVWLRSIWLPCEPTDWIQKMVQIGNEADFVYKRGLSTILHFSSWSRGMSTSNMYLSLILSAPVCTPEKFWIRSKKERSRTGPHSCAQGLREFLQRMHCNYFKDKQKNGSQFWNLAAAINNSTTKILIRQRTLYNSILIVIKSNPLVCCIQDFSKYKCVMRK